MLPIALRWRAGEIRAMFEAAFAAPAVAKASTDADGLSKAGQRRGFPHLQRVQPGTALPENQSPETRRDDPSEPRGRCLNNSELTLFSVAQCWEDCQITPLEDC